MTDSPVEEVSACQTESRIFWETPKKVPNLFVASMSLIRCLSFGADGAATDFLRLVLLCGAGEDFIDQRKLLRKEE